MTSLLPAFTGAPDDNRIYHTDALTLLQALPDDSVDLVLTDPPYGLGGQKDFVFAHKLSSAVREVWDVDVPTAWLDEAERVLKPGGSLICFGGRQSIYTFAHEGLRRGWRLVNDVTWFKPNAAPNFTGRMMTESTERALWFCPSGSHWTYNRLWAKAQNNDKGYRDVWTFNAMGSDRYHPTQKPIALMERFVGLLSNPGDLVLDPFMGSGTTAVAARNLGRRFIGCDLSLEYVEIARRRLQNTDPYSPTEHENGVVQHTLFGAEVTA